MDEIAAALNVINAISHRLSGDYNLDELLPQIACRTREVLRCDRVHLYLLDETGDALILTAACGVDGVETKQPEIRIPLDHPTSPTAHAAREAICISGDSAGEPDHQTAPFLADLRFAVAAPIIENKAEGHRAIGSLTAYCGEKIETDAWESDWLQGAANQMALAIIHDRLSTEMQEARRAAKRSDQAKSEFLSRVSHELRTPLNGILGYTQILKRSPDLTPAQHNGLNIIQESGEHLLALINDILDLAEIETQKIDFQVAVFDLNDFLQEVVGIAQMRAQKKRLNVTREALPTLPESICADEKRLRKVLTNLLNNAIKFTESGGVTLRVQAVATPQTIENGKMLRFTVTDTGIGIAPERLAKIFTPFEQTSDDKLPVEGAGLGLAISRHIVRMMGSELLVESEIGRGSTFWFDLTVKTEAECASLPEPERSQGNVGSGDAILEMLADIELAPPQEELSVLYEIAKLGNMRKINDWAKDLIKRDASYRPFAEKVQELARSFQKKQIVILAERYLEV